MMRGIYPVALPRVNFAERDAPRLTPPQRVVFLTGAARDRTVHGLLEERGVPLVSELDDSQIVLDAVRLAVFVSVVLPAKRE
jgi:hypothetical protein